MCFLCAHAKHARRSPSGYRTERTRLWDGILATGEQVFSRAQMKPLAKRNALAVVGLVAGL